MLKLDFLTITDCSFRKKFGPKGCVGRTPMDSFKGGIFDF